MLSALPYLELNVPCVIEHTECLSTLNAYSVLHTAFSVLKQSVLHRQEVYINLYR